MTKREKLPLVIDYVFKRVFAYEGNEDVLADFLESILNVKIEKLEVKNPEMMKNSREEKLGVLDIKVETKENIIDLEMQVEDEENIEEREATYMGKLLSEQLEVGDEYKKLKKSVVIFITNFNKYETNTYHNVAKMRFEKINKDEYVDMGYKEEEQIGNKYIEFHVIELPKFIKKNPGVEKRLEQWLWLIVGRKEKVEMAVKENKNVKKADKVLERISKDPKERERYEAILKAEFNQKISNQKFMDKGIIEGEARGKIIGREEGMKEGKKEGKKQNQIEIAKKMLGDKIEIKTIEKYTGLTEEEINELKN